MQCEIEQNSKLAHNLVLKKMFFRITTTTHIIIIAIHMKINQHKIKITKKNSKLQIIQTKCVKIKPTAYLVFPHFNFKFLFF